MSYDCQFTTLNVTSKPQDKRRYSEVKSDCPISKFRRNDAKGDSNSTQPAQQCTVQPALHLIIICLAYTYLITYAHILIRRDDSDERTNDQSHQRKLLSHGPWCTKTNSNPWPTTRSFSPASAARVTAQSTASLQQLHGLRPWRPPTPRSISSSSSSSRH
jgi:hypothetical protein